MKDLTLFKHIPSKRNAALLIIISFLLVLGLIETRRKVGALILKRRFAPYVFIGDEFSYLQNILKNIPRIGYFTNKPLTDRYTEAQFTQAQYTLAPIILEMNSLEHPFIIFDFVDSRYAVENIQKLGMIPLHRSPSGIILAKNPKYQTP